MSIISDNEYPKWVGYESITQKVEDGEAIQYL